MIEDTFRDKWEIKVDSKCKKCLVALNQWEYKEDITKEFIIEAMGYIAKKQKIPNKLLYPFSKWSTIDYCNLFFGLLKHIPDAYTFQQSVKNRNMIIERHFGILASLIINYDPYRHRKLYKFNLVINI